MKRVALGAALLVLAGCGSAEQGSSDAASDPTPTATADRVCGYGSFQGRRLTTADLDGDGTDEVVRLTRAAGECGPALVASAKSAEGAMWVTEVSVDGPPVTGAFAITVPGDDGQLLATRADHPRGGYQLRVYAAGDEALVELEADGGTLVPFVVTDVQEHPFSIDCADGGLVLTDAVLHEPIGVAPAWDVTRTTYAVDGTTVTAGATEEVADNVPTKQLGADYPELLAHAAFESCRAG
jgi:hypothetical protein